jgi:two-component system, NarL family, response regulator NreC
MTDGSWARELSEPPRGLDDLRGLSYDADALRANIRLCARDCGGSMTIRVVVADDHGVVRAGLRALLNAEPDIEVGGEAGDGHQALRLAREVRPDIMLLDVTMPGPGSSGIDVARLLKAEQSETKILILTLHEDVSILRAAINAGASGYVIKRAVDRDLIAAIHAVSRGELYVHPTMTQALLANGQPLRPSAETGASPLTRREVEVLRLIAKGYTSRQIADELHLSLGTVNSHRANITGKLAVTSRMELVRYATEHGLTD